MVDSRKLKMMSPKAETPAQANMEWKLSSMRSSDYEKEKKKRNLQNTLVSWSKMAAKLEGSKVPGVTDCIDQVFLVAS